MCAKMPLTSRKQNVSGKNKVKRKLVRLMTTALIIFVLMYAGMLIFSRLRVWFALAAAACMVIFGVLPIGTGKICFTECFIERRIKRTMAGMCVPNCKENSLNFLSLLYFL